MLWWQLLLKVFFFKDFIDDGNIFGVGSGGGVNIGFGGSCLAHHQQQ